MLGIDLHGWEYIMIASLVLVAVATGVVVKLQRAELATSEREMREYQQASNERIADANKSAAEANKIAAEAVKETAVAKLAAEKLRLRLVWRMIDPIPQGRLTDAMKRFAPQPFGIETDTNDLESSNLAANIRGALEKAGWEFRGVHYLGAPQVGVWLAWANESAPIFGNTVVRPLEAALKDAGVGPQGWQVGGNAAHEIGVIYIIVGKKPLSSIEIPSLVDAESAQQK